MNARADVFGDLGMSAPFPHGLVTTACCRRELVSCPHVLAGPGEWAWLMGVMNFDLGSGQRDLISSQGSW